MRKLIEGMRAAMGWRRAAAMVSFLVVAVPGLVRAQAVPTARQGLQISAFAGAAGVYTGLGGGRNLSVNAGVDLAFRPYLGLSPTVEVRAMYPVDAGSVDSQENVLGGLLLGRRFRGLHPYVDFLYGRGKIVYTPPYPDPVGALFYVQTTSSVLSPGRGWISI